MTDYKKLCAELVEKIEYTWGSGVPADVRELLKRVRAAMADEATSVTENPTDEDLLNLHDWMTDEWAANHDFELPPSQYARAVLASWGHFAPLPPAEGEVAELVEWLYEQLHVCLQAPWTPGIKHFGRAANLLERKYPQPVPVSERWPEFSDCDDADHVWCWSWAIGTWRLGRISRSIHSHWLPAHALPLPTAND